VSYEFFCNACGTHHAIGECDLDPRNCPLPEPYQITLSSGRTVCGIHDYTAPDRGGMQRCRWCGCTRHKDSEI